MSDNENQSEGEAPEKPTLNLSRLYPKMNHAGEEFISSASSLGVRRELRKELNASENINPIEFAKSIVSKSLRSVESDEPVGPDRAAQLVGEKGFLEKFIEMHPEFFSEYGRGENGGKARWWRVLEREEDEGAAEYLLRAYRDHLERDDKRAKEINEKLMKQYKGLTGALSTPGLDALIKSVGAAGRINDLVNKTRNPISDQILDQHSFEPALPRDIPIVQNPIHETNAQLRDVATSMEEMRELYLQQATMQESLNKVATEILENFVTGSKIAEQNSKRALAVAILAVVVAATTFVYSQFFDNTAPALIKGQAEITSVLEDIREGDRFDRELAKGQNELLEKALTRNNQKQASD